MLRQNDIRFTTKIIQTGRKQGGMPDILQRKGKKRMLYFAFYEENEEETLIFQGSIHFGANLKNVTFAGCAAAPWRIVE